MVCQLTGTHNVQPKTEEELQIKAKHGKALMENYMDILNDPAVWVDKASCHLHAGECLTPVGWARAEQSQKHNNPTGKENLIVFVGGTTCVDVSGMGTFK